MKITCTPIPAAAAIILGDDAAGDFILEVPLPQEARSAQVEPLFRSDNPFAEPRGNKLCSFSWSVSRQHASADAAAAFVLTHRASVPKKCSIAILQGATTTTFVSALIVAVEAVSLVGRSTVMRYSVTGAKEA